MNKDPHPREPSSPSANATKSRLGFHFLSQAGFGNKGAVIRNRRHLLCLSTTLGAGRELGAPQIKHRKSSARSVSSVGSKWGRLPPYWFLSN